MPDDKSLPTLAVELKDLVVAYAKQETIEPIKGLGRFIAFGLAGSMLLSVGLVLLVIGVLRALQTETGGAFDGNFTFAPYLITFFVSLVVVGIAARSIGKARRRAKENG